MRFGANNNFLFKCTSLIISVKMVTAMSLLNKHNNEYDHSLLTRSKVFDFVNTTFFALMIKSIKNHSKTNEVFPLNY